MTVEELHWTIRPVGEFSEVQHIWDYLNEQLGQSPILESRFFSLLLEYLPPGDARVCVLRRAGEPLAACILERTKFGVWSTYQPSQAPLGAFVSKYPDIQTLALRNLLRQMGGLGLALGLTQLDSYFCDHPGESPNIRTDDYIETACLHTLGDFDEYWGARGKNLRQNNRKQRNRLKRDGVNTSLEVVENVRDIGEAVDAFGRLESAGWKSEVGTALHPSNRQGAFYRELLESYAGHGRARVYQYFFDSDLVACDLCLVGEKVLIILKTTYSEQHSRYSPAMLMREEQAQSLFEDRNVDAVEFYGKALDWHRRLTDDIRTIFHVTVFRAPILRKMISLRSVMSRSGMRSENGA